MKKLYLILLIVLLLCAEAFPADIGFCRKHGGGAAVACTASTPGTDNSEIGTVNAGGSHAVHSTNRMYCELYQADCTGTLGTAYMYGSTAISGVAKVSVYSTTDTTSSSTPTVGTRVGYSGEITFGASAAWVNSATGGGSVTANGYYWLCFHTSAVAPDLYYTTGLSRWYIAITGAYDTPPAALPVAGDCTASKTPYSCCTGEGTGCTWTETANAKSSIFVGIQ